MAGPRRAGAVAREAPRLRQAVDAALPRLNPMQSLSSVCRHPQLPEDEEINNPNEAGAD